MESKMTSREETLKSLEKQWLDEMNKDHPAGPIETYSGLECGVITECDVGSWRLIIYLTEGLRELSDEALLDAAGNKRFEVAKPHRRSVVAYFGNPKNGDFPPVHHGLKDFTDEQVSKLKYWTRPEVMEIAKTAAGSLVALLKK